MSINKKNQGPYLRYKIRTGDGAIMEGRGSCTDRQGFAVYMIALLGDKPKTDTPLQRAVGKLLEVCEEVLVEVEKGNAVKVGSTEKIAEAKPKASP